MIASHHKGLDNEEILKLLNDLENEFCGKITSDDDENFYVNDESNVT